MARMEPREIRDLLVNVASLVDRVRRGLLVSQE